MEKLRGELWEGRAVDGETKALVVHGVVRC